MTNLAKFPELDHVPYPYAGSIAIDIGDLVFQQSDFAVPATSLTGTGSETSDATAYVPSFAGVARERKLATDLAGSIDVTPFWVGDVPCPATVWHVGALVTMSENTGNTGLLSQQVQATTDTATAIGVCVQDSQGVATTTVRVFLQSRVTPISLSALGALFSEGLTLGDGGNVTLGTATGSKLGTAASQKLAFFNATPVAQPAGASQAAVTNSTGGTPNGTMAAVTATNSSDQSAVINKNFSELYTLLTAMRSALVTLGLIKGSS
jgi:hypothetical protein